MDVPRAARGEHAAGPATDLNVLSTIFLRMIKSLIVPLLFVDARGRHRGPRRRHEARRQARVPLDHLLRDRHDARAGGRPARREHRQAGRRRRTSRSGVGEGRRRPRDEARDVRGVLEHTVPQSFFEAAAKNEVLQIVFFAIIFAVALSQVQGRRRRSCSRSARACREVMFKFDGHRDEVRADRHRRGDRGDGRQERARRAARTSALLVGHAVRRADRVRARACSCRSRCSSRFRSARFCRRSKEPWLIAFTTASSEAALPLRDGAHGAVRRAAPHRRVRAAHGLLVQPRRQHALSRAGVGVRGAGGRASTCRSRRRS